MGSKKNERKLAHRLNTAAEQLCASNNDVAQMAAAFALAAPSAYFEGTLERSTVQKIADGSFSPDGFQTYEVIKSALKAGWTSPVTVKKPSEGRSIHLKGEEARQARDLLAGLLTHDRAAAQRAVGVTTYKDACLIASGNRPTTPEMLMTLTALDATRNADKPGVPQA